MQKQLKPRHKFITSASYLMNRGANKDDIYELAKDFDVTTEYVDDYLKNQVMSKAVGGAVVAGKEEKDMLYNMLDEKFLTEYPDIVIFRRGENVSYYEYKGGVYNPIMAQDMYNYIDALMAKYMLMEHRTSSKRVKDTIERVGALLSRTVGRSFADEDTYNRRFYLNLKNGLLDMSTFEMKPHSRDYFSTVQVQYVYDPKATCPEFEQFIRTVSGGSDSTGIMIKQMFGYSIMDGNPLHKVFYLYGDTARNGKSTTAKLLAGLIGWGNVSTLTLQQIGSENSSILTSIVGKQINFSDEISSKYIDSSRLTSVSAESNVEVNPKYKPAFMYTVRAKFIIACNDLPRFSDFQGMKHRMISIPFRYHLKEGERIQRYDEILLEREGAGILNWAIEGAKTLKDGNFIVNEDSKEDIQENVLQSYPVYSFLESMYDFSPSFTKEIDPKELYGNLPSKESRSTGFRLFCEEDGLRTISFPTFTRELKRFSRETGKITQIRVGHRSERRYVGLKLKSDIDAEKEMEDVKNSVK